MAKFKLGLAVAAVLSLTACGNMEIVDTTWTFTKAECRMPNGSSKEFEVASWKDYEDSDMIQIKTKDGLSFLTHSSNCYLKTK